MADTERTYQDALADLARLRGRALALELVSGLVRALAALLVSGLVWTAAEAALYLSPPWRSGLGAFLALAALAAPALYLYRRLPLLLPLQRFGLVVEARCPQLKQRLISALELWQNPQASRLYSRALLEATVEEAAALLARIEPGHILDLHPLKRHARQLGAALALCLLALALFPEALGGALGRCAHPLTHFERQARTQIAIAPGDMEIVKGDDARIALHFSGERPRTALLQRREVPEAPWQEEEIVVDEADSIAYVFKQVKRAFSYRVEAGDGRSPAFKVEVIEPPAVKRLRLHYEYPAYSRLPTRVEEESGDIHSLPGTRIDFEVVASKALGEATLVLDDTLRLPARVEGERARVSLEIRRDGRYHLELVDHRGVANRDPIRYAIQVSRDEAPRVAITEPGRDADLPDNLQILLAAEAQDDYGVERLLLVHRVNDGQERSRALSFVPGRKVALTYLWDLSTLQLLPEDRVHYRLEAFDNDQVSGPNKGMSREYVLRFPSLHELFEESTRQQEEHLETLETLAEGGRQTSEYLEEVRRELLKREELSWEKKKELEATLEREGERARALEELAQEMQNTIAEMEKNALASEEVLSKLQQLRELMAQVATPELQEALQQLQQAMEESDPSQLAEALRRFNEDQQSFQERLERTISLLEQVRAEQALEAAVKQAEDLRQRQAQINQELADDESGVRLQMQEGNLQRDTERLREELAALGEDMERIDEETARGLTRQAEEMEAGDLSGRMREMVRHMREMANSQARRLGEGLEEDLGQLAASLQQLQGEFVAGQKMEMAQDMRRAMRELLQLSQNQEELRQVTRQLPQAVPPALAEEQFALLQGVSRITERIADVARRTLSLDNALAATLGHVLQNMQEAALHLGQQDGRRADAPQGTSMQRLNEAVVLLRQSLDNLASAQMPSSFAEAMQKMLGLSEQQADLNQATQQTLARGRQQGMQGQPGGQDLRRDMARLAAEQRRLFQALDELRRSVEGQRGAQRRVEAIQEEMQNVIADLERRRLDGRTVANQERILQRMLDASRSIHTRDFKEERQSTSAGEHSFAGPSGLPPGLGQRREELREAMKEALEGPYPEEYRPLIQRYYEQVYQDVIERRETPRP